MHEKLWRVTRLLDPDYEPCGKAERDGPDCSCGCRYFAKLSGNLGNDWGVCANPDSPRAGLLTFEHQGCSAFESSEDPPVLSEVRPVPAATATPPGGPALTIETMEEEARREYLAGTSACWAFADEAHPQAALAFQRIQKEEALVPSLWWFEVRKILVVNERRKRIDESATASFLRELARIPIRMDRMPVEGEVLRLARTRRLSVYDAAYLELAQREGLPLATLDRDLAAAARAEGVPILGEC